MYSEKEQNYNDPPRLPQSTCRIINQNVGDIPHASADITLVI
jgi:hypothetical protein